MPEVVADPLGEVATTFQGLGVCVVQQCAKIRQQGIYLFSIALTVMIGKLPTILHILPRT